MSEEQVGVAVAMAAAAATESISARSVRLNQLFLEKSSAAVLGSEHLMSRESLLDALNALYEECQQDAIKKDRNVAIFIEKFRVTMSSLRKLRVSVADFELKKVIGRGHFGDVHVVREKHTGCVYAMKVLRKSDTLAQHNVAFYDEERDIMAKAKSVWITKLQYAFQDASNLYLVMEFLPGGDLLSLLDRHDGVLPEDAARFFLAEIVLAIHALHCMGYVHRDIKPDNVLVDRTGHIKLVDFGSAARLTRFDTVSSRMPVGTPDYIAPEVLASIEGKKGSYGRSCDFWSLGVVAYEMLYGKTPFSETKVVSTYNNIMNFKKTLVFGDCDDASEEAKHLMKGLLTETTHRLDFEGICRHEFFRSIDWEGIRESLPPFVPTVIGQDDTSNFEEFDAVPPKADIPELPKQQGSFSGKNLPFVGFTYTQLMDFPAECNVSSSPSRKSLTNLESQLMAKKREVGELRIKLDSLEKLDVGCRVESAKLALQLKEQEKIKVLAESECERLCKEISVQKSQCASYRRLVELERSERLKTEKKAIQLLKEIKDKWKNAEKLKLDTLSKENDSLKSFIRELEGKYREARIEALTRQEDIAGIVKMAENATSKAKHYKEKFRRSSVTDALSGEIIRQQLGHVERQLVELGQEKAAVDAELDVFKAKADKLQDDCGRLESLYQDSVAARIEIVKELDKEVDDLKVDLGLANQRLADKDADLAVCNERIGELEMRLHDELGCRRTVEQQFQELVKHREDPEEMDRPSNHRHSFRRAKLIAKLEEVESELDGVKKDNAKLQDELLTAKDSDSEKTQTVEELRVIVDRLECGLKRLDNVEPDKCGDREQVDSSSSNRIAGGESSDRERIFFEAQISKLEGQLETAKEALLREKQEARQLRSDFFKIERELRDTKIDLRIVTRESKSAAEQLVTLQDQATVANAGCQKSEAASDALRVELVEARRQLDSTGKELQRKEKSWDTEKARLTEKIATLQSSCQELRGVHTKLGESDGRSQELEKRLKVNEICRNPSNAEELLKRADDERRLAQKREEQARVESKNVRSELDRQLMNYDGLKQACQSMEEQLGDYERLVEVHESDEIRLKAEVASANKTVETLRKEVKQAIESATTERTKAELAAKESEELVRKAEMGDVVHESEVQSLAAQRNEYRSMVSELSQQVAELEGELKSYETKLGGSQYRQAALGAETVRVKEEAAQLITQIHSLRDTNFKVSRSLEEAEEGRTAARTRCVELENTLREERVSHQVQRVKYDETMAQQTKLIHFLQMKAEAAQKRKKTFTEKIFGTRNGVDTAKDQQFVSGSPTGTSFRISTTHRDKPKTSTTNGHTDDGCQNGGARNGVSSTVASKDMLATLSKSPGLQESPDRPTTRKGIPKPSTERMRHNIPHQFQIGLCMHPTKCAACLGTIHFGRNVARCIECRISAHTKCSSSLPNACNLPMGLMQHFRHSMRYSSKSSSSSTSSSSSSSGAVATQPKGPDALDNLSGWMKVPKSRGNAKGTQNYGWDRTFARLEGTVLRLYDGIDDKQFSSSPSTSIDLCAADNTVKVVEAVMPHEMSSTAKSDLPYIFKLVVQPTTTCWPSRCIYLMAHSFQEKLDWVAALEKLVRSNSTAADLELLGSVLLSIEDALNVDLNCIAFLDADNVLIGAEDGLYIVDLMEDKNARPKICIPTFGAVYQMSVVTSIGVLILIAGNERRLYWITLSDVCSLVIGEVQFTASHLSMLHSVANVSCCHLFVVTSPSAGTPEILKKTSKRKLIAPAFCEESDDGSPTTINLCAATADRVVIFAWNVGTKIFCLRKELATSKPCSCVLFTENSVIVGTDKFYEVDLANLTVEEFLDDSDPSLKHVVRGAHLIASFPMAIFRVSPLGTQPEYLLCFYELGVFVDAYGRRSRRDDLRWTHLPLAFAFRWPYLYIVHFTSIEVYEIIVHKEKCFSVQTFVDVSSPRYLGASLESGTIVVAVVKDGQADVVCFNGEAAVKRKATKIGNEIEQASESNYLEMKGVVDNNNKDGSESEFSFTSSVMQALDEDEDNDNDNMRLRDGGNISAPESEV